MGALGSGDDQKQFQAEPRHMPHRKQGLLSTKNFPPAEKLSTNNFVHQRDAYMMTISLKNVPNGKKFAQL
jgi:hypothetical protein